MYGHFIQLSKILLTIIITYVSSIDIFILLLSDLLINKIYMEYHSWSHDCEERYS